MLFQCEVHVHHVHHHHLHHHRVACHAWHSGSHAHHARHHSASTSSRTHPEVGKNMKESWLCRILPVANLTYEQLFKVVNAWKHV